MEDLDKDVSYNYIRKLLMIVALLVLGMWFNKLFELYIFTSQLQYCLWLIMIHKLMWVLGSKILPNKWLGYQFNRSNSYANFYYFEEFKKIKTNYYKNDFKISSDTHKNTSFQRKPILKTKINIPIEYQKKILPLRVNSQLIKVCTLCQCLSNKW